MNTNTYNKILCATDFSDPSYEGLTAAADLARQFNASLTVVHVIAPMPAVPTTTPFAASGIDLKQYFNNVEVSAKGELNRLATRYSTPGLEIGTAILTGDPAEEIVDYAAANRCDMIVLSTHGHSGWKRFITGSVAEKVVRSADRAVLTVHRSEDGSERNSKGQEQEAQAEFVEVQGTPAIDVS